MKLTALIGDKVEHSVSDVMFKFYAESCELSPYAHLKIAVPSERENLLGWALKGLIGLGFAGANITLPYKEKVLGYLDETDSRAARMGAVNTIKVSGDRLVGYNTDGPGALTSLEFEGRKVSPGDRAVIFGAGGAAKAISFELYARTRNVLIVNRTFERAVALAAELERVHGGGARAMALSDFVREGAGAASILEEAEFVLNATSVGMAPDVGRSVIPPRLLDEVSFEGKVAFDAIYNPLETKFLERARLNSAVCVNGLGMMLWQGVEAFRIWTGAGVDASAVAGVRRVLEEALAKGPEAGARPAMQRHGGNA